MKQLVNLLIAISLWPTPTFAGGWGFDPMLVNAQNSYKIAITYFDEGNVYSGCYYLNSAHKFAEFAKTDHGQAMAKILIMKQKYNCKFTKDYQK